MPQLFTSLYRVCRNIGWIFLLTFLIIISGCAELSSKRFNASSLTSFPPLIIENEPDVDPASHASDVVDVDIFALNDEMKRILNEFVIHIEDPRQRLETLLEVVFHNHLFNITDEKYRTKTAIETFNSGTGNCLSFSIAFVAMARYVGLTTGFQDVESLPNWDQIGKIITISKHISVVVALNVFTEYEIDFYYQNGFSNPKEKERILNQNRLFEDKNRISTSKISDSRAIAQYYNNIGAEFLAEGNLRNAFRYYVKALKTDPKLGFVWSNLGAVYRQNNQLKAAEMAYQQAISINPYEFSAMGNLARLYTYEGRIKEADLIKRKIQSFQDKNPYNHYAWGKKAFDSSRFEESIKHFKRAIRRKKDEHLFYYALALAYLKTGDYKMAQKNMEQARAFSPNETVLNYYSQKWKDFSQDISYNN